MNNLEPLTRAATVTYKCYTELAEAFKDAPTQLFEEIVGWHVESQAKLRRLLKKASELKTK